MSEQPSLEKTKTKKKEYKVLVRLFEDDIEIFESVREHTKCYIDAEVFRILLRKYHENNLRDTS